MYATKQDSRCMTACILACIDVEQIISGHSRLAWHTSRDDDQMAVVQGIGKLLRSKMTGDLHITTLLDTRQSV